MQAIPARSNVGEIIGGSRIVIDIPDEKQEKGGKKKKGGPHGFDSDEEYQTGRVSSPSSAFTLVWSILIHCAASDPKIHDEELYRYIKDAADYKAIR